MTATMKPRHHPDATRRRRMPDHVIDQLFVQARSQNGWLAEPVHDTLLKELYDICKMGPTSMNCCPMRLVFVRTEAGKQRILPAIGEGNIAKVKSAPVVAVIAYDTRFYDHMGKLFPHSDVRSVFAGNMPHARATAVRNGNLQGAYFMLAARALGLDCGPLSGFDNARLDEILFQNSSYVSNFICCLGHGDETKLFDRLPRFEFAEICEML